jgi:uncharacterized membrane protein YsdA (DUF1294 family)/cold shock CspA family protein
MTREVGELIEWNNDRGFGFIQRPDNEGKIYVHIKAIRKGVERPKLGDWLTYDVAHDKSGRTTAAHATVRGAKYYTRGAPRLWGAAIITALIIAGVMLGRLPVWVPALYVLAGIGSFFYYGADKVRANRKSWRTPERMLHLVDLTFGIVGGLLGQHIFRHKLWKTGFVYITGLTAALHAMTLGLIAVGVFAG